MVRTSVSEHRKAGAVYASGKLCRFLKFREGQDR